MTPETLVVPRAPFDMEEPWTVPPGCNPIRLRSALDGSPPRLATSVAAWWDPECLSVLFSAADDFVVATHLQHDAPLYEEDVVEVFLAPGSLKSYFELEANPLGTLFDAAIDSPDGVRATMRADRSWTCEGLVAILRTTFEGDGMRTVDTLLRIPFRALGLAAAPSVGDRWRANFFRIDRHPRRGDEFSAWHPTLRVPADFHVAEAFGALEFHA
jgi:hypothetical protein